MKRKVLVLGGHGFMGKNIQAVFKDSEYEMYYESRSSGCNIFYYDGFKKVVADIAPDVIIFAAAHVGSIGYVSKYAGNVVNDNTQLYLNLYKCVAEVNPNILIINSISNCSYPGYIDVQHEELWWNGEVHESVESYGMPKKMGFIISECYKKQYGIQTINLIIPNSYGELDYVDVEKTHAMDGIIMRMIKAKRDGENTFIVWGTGTPVREWIYMPDVVRIMKKILDDKMYDLPNPINLGQEHGISIKESVEVIREKLDYDVVLTNDTSKQDGAPLKVLGAKLFKEHFPDFKFTDYDVGINNTIEYYKKIL